MLLYGAEGGSLTRPCPLCRASAVALSSKTISLSARKRKPSKVLHGPFSFMRHTRCRKAWKLGEGSAIFYAMCSFLLKKYKTGGELVAWARSEWESAAGKHRMFVQGTHHSDIQALEHDSKQWAIACSKGESTHIHAMTEAYTHDIY